MFLRSLTLPAAANGRATSILETVMTSLDSTPARNLNQQSIDRSPPASYRAPGPPEVLLDPDELRLYRSLKDRLYMRGVSVVLRSHLSTRAVRGVAE